MKRVLIFTIFFPPIALAVFNSPDMIAGRFDLMNFTALQLTYVITIIPAWFVAAIDNWQKVLWKTTCAGPL